MNPRIGYFFDPHDTSPGGALLTARIDALDPECVRDFAYWNGIESVRGQRDWSYLDRVVLWNALRGRKLVLCVSPYPEWLAKLPPDEWHKERTSFVTELVKRYGDFYALESVNEPSGDSTPASWGGYIPGINPGDMPSFYKTLARIFAADRESVKGTRIKLAGPAMGQWDAVYVKKLLQELAWAGNAIDIITFHSYGEPAENLYARCLEYRAIAGGRPIHCNEFSQWIEPELEPFALTADQAKQEIRDARTCARAFLTTNVVPFPFLALIRSASPGGFRRAGYEWAAGNEPFVMKEWLREFLYLMKLGLTTSQLAVTP